ncbi:hypothetical protein MIND_00693300 [Mycena indigotica]|uniref:Tetraspanin Tsp2 n=1 Tax=Mycena indigotica TaxID=2126181 RepID=A0A8H6W6N9_9AGAR|nr:uncharacterized protein MIND_00693300 [Mycena indigotica]KAF7301284.1 hypothetical protein MIND_00693300 [Mycena indigotica]
MQRVWSTYLENSNSRRGRTDSPHKLNSSRESSIAPSVISQAPLVPNAQMPSRLDPSHLAAGSSSPNPFDGGSTVSLTVNYLPSKLPVPGSLKRRSGKGVDGLFRKPGGGVDAFRSGEARMPDAHDEDYDGVNGTIFGGRRKRWNKFKWILFIANTLLICYSLLALVFCLLTWFNVWQHADIIRVANRSELVLSTLAASVAIFTSLLGFAGILLNNRGFLAVYTFLLWICFALMVIPGYLTYKHRHLNIEGKVNNQWSRDLGALGRLRIQNELSCCGYFSPYVEATVSSTCYSRSILPGCKKPYLNFEKLVLERWYIAAFGLVPVHIGVILSGLLCSNHVTYRFGKGMTPKAYRLSAKSMALIMDNYANQLAEQYGPEAAHEMLARSRSNLNLSDDYSRR